MNIHITLTSLQTLEIHLLVTFLIVMFMPMRKGKKGGWRFIVLALIIQIGAYSHYAWGDETLKYRTIQYIFWAVTTLYFLLISLGIFWKIEFSEKSQDKSQSSENNSNGSDL